MYDVNHNELKKHLCTFYKIQNHINAYGAENIAQKVGIFRVRSSYPLIPRKTKLLSGNDSTLQSSDVHGM